MSTTISDAVNRLDIRNSSPSLISKTSTPSFNSRRLRKLNAPIGGRALIRPSPPADLTQCRRECEEIALNEAAPEVAGQLGAERHIRTLPQTRAKATPHVFWLSIVQKKL